MAAEGRGSEGSLEQSHAAVVAELRSQRSEIAQALHARICDVVPDRMVDNDDKYREHLAATVDALVAYSLEAIERMDETLPIPSQALAQARYAARAGVSLGVVLRRYQTGYHKLVGCIVEEAERLSYPPGRVRLHLLQVYGPLIERLTAAIEREYVQEHERVAGSPDRRRMEIVRKLLADEPVEPAELAELDYKLDLPWHLGVIATGAKAGEVLQCLKAGLGCDLLSISDGNATVWAWLGGHAKVTVAEFKRLVSVNGPPGAPLAVGEPGHGLHGWRQTHEEAQVALLIARHEPRGLTRCADALPVVGALQSEAIIRMYEKTYILPLNNLHKGGQPARKSLLAYFKHGRNASSAGGAINVTGRTVQNHLNDVRKVLDAPLNLTGLEIALRLEELGYMAEAKDAPPPPR